MSKLNTWLGGLLALQLVLAGGLYWNTQYNQAAYQRTPLFSFSKKSIDRVVIGDGKHTITLKKQHGHWVLPDNGALPVNTGKLDDVLDKAVALKNGWPEATTTAAQKRFEVAKKLYQRQLQLYQGDQQRADLYLGTSQGFRQTHIRRAGSKKIYSANFNNYELGTDVNNWFDKTLLSVKGLQSIKGSDFKLIKQKGKWALVSSTQDTQKSKTKSDTYKAGNVADILTHLRVGILSDLPLKQADATLVASDGKHQWTYRLGHKGDQYVISRNDINKVFTINKHDYDQLTQIDKPQLAKTGNNHNDNPRPGKKPTNG